MARSVRRGPKGLVPVLLHPLVSTGIGALVAAATTVAILYPLALHDWGNEARNIAGVASFYESGHGDVGLAQGRIERQPSEYLRVTEDALVFGDADPDGECRRRLTAPTSPLGRAADAWDMVGTLDQLCREHDVVVGRFDGRNALIAAVPVIGADGQLAGVRVQRSQPTAAPSLVEAATEKRALFVIAAVAALVASIGFLAGRLGRAHIDRMERAASVDGLTGCLRREAFLEAAEHAIHDARRRGETLSALAVDVDWLKQINDRFGHSGGDAALVLVSASMKSSLSGTDIIGRIGGDEFAAILPAADAEEAEAVAERLRAAVAVVHLALKGEVSPLSVSVGTATLCEGDDPLVLIERADGALYGSKRARPKRAGGGTAA